MNVDYVGDQRKQFILSRKVLDYSDNLTIGDVLAKVREIQNSNEELESRVTFREFVMEVGRHFAKGTRFADHVQINGPPQADYPNIYFLNDDPDRLTQYFKNNCSYIGYQNAIICDAAFVSTYLARFNQIDKLYDTLITEYDPGEVQGFSASLTKNTELVSQYLKQNFLIWLIGHEIGHAILHKHHVMLEPKDLHFDLNYDDNEKQADSFVANNIVTSPTLGVHFRVLLGEFIQQEFRNLYKAQHPQESTNLSESEDRQLILNKKINVNYSRYSVPIILRAVRLMEVISAQNSSIKESAQYGIIDSKIVLMDSLYPVNPYQQIAENIVIPPRRSSRIPATYVVLVLVSLACICIALTTRMHRQHRA